MGCTGTTESTAPRKGIFERLKENLASRLPEEVVPEKREVVSTVEQVAYMASYDHTFIGQYMVILGDGTYATKEVAGTIYQNDFLADVCDLKLARDARERVKMIGRQWEDYFEVEELECPYEAE